MCPPFSVHLSLCHHTFEPCDRIKLGAVADIYGYARCLHFLSPLPVMLAEKLGAPTVRAPAGVGNGFPTLSSIDNSAGSLASSLNRLLDCSDWWRHIYYAVPPERSLTPVRLIRHPARIIYWLNSGVPANKRLIDSQGLFAHSLFGEMVTINPLPVLAELAAQVFIVNQPGQFPAQSPRIPAHPRCSPETRKCHPIPLP